MVRVKQFLIYIFTIGLFLPASSQSYTDKQSKLTEQLLSLSNNAPPELAYIQTSKDIYETGEDLWFKVYLLNAQFLIPSDLSKTLYIQMLNEKSKLVVWQEKYEILNGFANGRIYLETTLPEGEYLIAAYTPNSFFNDTAEFKAARRVKIKTDMTFRRSLIPNFDKVYYTGKDTIRIEFPPLPDIQDSLYAEITSTLQQGSKRVERVQTITNGQGEAHISFQPQDTKKELNVAMNIKYKDRTESLTMPVTTRGNPIQFTTFPEGGCLVSGIQSNLAFNAINSSGEPVDIAGTLFEDNIPLLKFMSTHAGMGSFNFTPETGKKYFIRLSEPTIDSTFLLPEIYPTGTTMHLDKRDKESLYFKLSHSKELKQEDVYLRVQCRGVVCGMITARLNRELRIKIPLQELPQGIIEVTLFNSNLVPVAERLIYINPDRKLNITTELSKEIFPTRGKATLKITVKDEYGKPVVANLGVSIFDKLYQNPRDSNNILSHFYLSTQLKGRIYNPSFYFNTKSKDREEALDLLMLTQGWRKYKWSEMNLGKYAAAREKVIFDGAIGKFTIQSIWKEVRDDQKFVFAYSPLKGKGNVLIPIDSSGVFAISSEYLKVCEGDYVYLKPITSSGARTSIKLTDPFETINLAMRTNEITYPLTSLENKKEEAPTDLVARAGVIMIKEVAIQGKKSNAIRGKYMGKLDSLANPDYVCIHNVLNCPNHVREAGYIDPVIGEKYLFYRNGAQLTEIVYDSTFYHSPMNHPTHVSYSEKELLEMYNLSRVKAYYGSREFYQPNYDQITEDYVLPDFRNTLLWEPSVVTNAKGEATLSFYCSDIYTEFSGRIEGVNSDGLLGTGYFNFTVRKLKLTP